MLDAYIYDGLRSPIGRHAGKLAGLRPDDLAGEVIAAVVKRNGINAAEISDVILGCVTQAGEDWDPLESTCRHASLSIL